MYLALLALVVLAVLAASRVVTAAVGRALLVGAVALLLATATIARNREYSSALSLARTVVERRPTSISHHILGVELIAAGQYPEAVAEFRRAIPGDSRAHYDLGLELSREGQLDEALAELRMYVATAHLPSRPVPHWLELAAQRAAGLACRDGRKPRQTTAVVSSRRGGAARARDRAWQQLREERRNRRVDEPRRGRDRGEQAR